ncbi:glycoside hydrolase family 1 protein [Baudoinia panamericana UAMH 10762]|uniref:Glycoside hydrolase family 1 protein n=1 Tax=Baudoinia panamericana (strain UAMH 10762) TaxID=717646 RepID=M2MKL6_BAUPA|nr:glycoside hydrolase family 1 protein [Baudoinia panamericana UAMH 10762]EMC91873.1 glycoside hydrolase family 1 protein [Baudoinia panamericana UAMH 10762]
MSASATSGSVRQPSGSAGSQSSIPAITESTLYSTTSFNFSAGTSTYLPLTDFSNEQLAFLWDQVGPRQTAAITTTVSPTPEPSVFPKPGNLHGLVPAYLQEVADAKLLDDFLWGVASAAFQVEGAVDAEGKGPSVWDLLPHRWANSIADNTTGDITANNYYLYKQDNARLKALGIQSYSFSIGWARIFPFGRGPVNAQGVTHYDDLFANLMDNDIKAVVTLFHWDTPLALFNSYGAWTSEDIVEDYFNYAKYVITRYDKYVTAWYTFNEPQYCNWRFSTYPYGTILPDYNGIGVGGGLRARFLCGHYTLLAHATVYKWYKEVFGGTKPMTHKTSANYILPNSSSAADAEAVTRQYDFDIGWFGGMWTNGDYPASLKSTLGDLLPTLTADQMALIKGSGDFYALDGYTANYAAAPPNGIAACAANRSDPNFPECSITSPLQPDGFPEGPNADAGASWLWSTPQAIRPFLSFITKDYFPTVPSIVVSEFGFADPCEASFNSPSQILWDLRRADYIQSYLDNILAARVLDGVNVTGAFAWAIYDNYEWNSGLGTRFGLQYNNMTSQERYPKASMFQFLNWFQTHGTLGSGAANITAPVGKVKRESAFGQL